MFIRWIALPPAVPHAKLCRMLSSKAIMESMGSALKTVQNKWGKHGKTMESHKHINICQDNIMNF